MMNHNTLLIGNISFLPVISSKDFNISNFWGLLRVKFYNLKFSPHKKKLEKLKYHLKI